MIVGFRHIRLEIQRVFKRIDRIVNIFFLLKVSKSKRIINLRQIRGKLHSDLESLYRLIKLLFLNQLKTFFVILLCWRRFSKRNASTISYYIYCIINGVIN